MSVKFAEPHLVENAYNCVLGTYFIVHIHHNNIATLSTRESQIPTFTQGVY